MGKIPNPMSKIPNYSDPRAQLEALLTATQQLWRKVMEGPDLPADERAMTIGRMLTTFSAAWYLRALMLRDDRVDVTPTCKALQDIIDSGEGVGEWTWDLLVELGIDPNSITPLFPPLRLLRPTPTRSDQLR